MPISPDEIQTKEFDRGTRGYDKDQVRAFLDSVASDYRAALRLGNYEAVGEEVGRILQTVNDSASALRSKATSEAEEIMANAEGEAAKVKSQAEVEAQGLRDHTNQQIKELIEEAERRVVEMDAKVRKETEARIRAADQRVETLRQAERDLRGRLERAREMLTSIEDQLDSGAPETESVPLEGAEEPASA